VGYCGGTTSSPTYYTIGDHTETLQVDYDPAQITYEQLLDMFWKTHNACASPGSRQYMSAVFYHDSRQRELALATREREAARRGARITTQVLPAGEFTLAEDYHQKYLLRQRRGLLNEVRAMYPSDADFVASTAAARVNGYLGGNGSAEQLQKEIGSLGLSPEAQQLLVQQFHRRR